MKEVLPTTSTATQTRQHSARWYQATTLSERTPFFKQDGSRQVGAQAASEKALQRLARWKNLPPFRRSEECFKQRLDGDGLSEQGLLTLLTQSAEEVQATCTEEPAWLEELLAAFTNPDPALSLIHI